MGLTFLYPFFNRSELFSNTLESFLEQERREEVSYEILALDDGSTEKTLLPLVKEYRGRGLWIRYVYIDNSAYADFDIYKIPMTGANNPAIALNIGLRLARTAKVVLSGPEMKHTKPTNLIRLATYPLQSKQWLCCDVWDEGLKRFNGGGPDRRTLNFLSLHNTEDLYTIGGVCDERFMGGWAWEDTELVNRMTINGIQVIFSGEFILANHQHHTRPGVDEQTPQDFMQAWFRNEKLYNALLDIKIANADHHWGNLAMVKEMWP